MKITIETIGQTVTGDISASIVTRIYKSLLKKGGYVPQGEGDERGSKIMTMRFTDNPKRIINKYYRNKRFSDETMQLCEKGSKDTTPQRKIKSDIYIPQNQLINDEKKEGIPQDRFE